jgi:TonB family protein
MRTCGFATLIAISILSMGAEIKTEPELVSEPSEECQGNRLDDAVAIYTPIPPGGLVRNKCKERRLRVPLVRYTIEPNGRVSAIDFIRSSGCKEADRELRRCIIQWIYEPAKCSGIPVPIQRRFHVNWGYGPPPYAEHDYCQSFEDFKRRERRNDLRACDP